MKKATRLCSPLRGVLMGALVSASSAAFAATVTIGEGTLSGDQLTIPVTLDEAAEVGVYIGAAGPRDGDPADIQKLKQSFDLGSGTTSVTVTIPVGAKIAYSARTVDGSSETLELTATDTSEYVWVNNAKGNRLVSFGSVLQADCAALGVRPGASKRMRPVCTPRSWATGF